MMGSSYDKDTIEKAVKASKCYADVFKNLGVKVNGGSYPWVKSLIEKFSIDIEHFYTKEQRDRLRAEKMKEAKKRDLSQPLPCDRRLKNRDLKKHMNYQGIPYKCNVCNLSQWNNVEIVLDIDHIDNDAHNNKLNNLQYVCPNCHRVKTSDFLKSIPSKAKKSTKNYNYDQNKKCSRCGVKITNASKVCRSCTSFDRSPLYRIGKDKIQEEILKKPLREVAKDIGCAYKNIRNFCKKYELKQRPVGYWSKIRYQEGKLTGLKKRNTKE